MRICSHADASRSRVPPAPGPGGAAALSPAQSAGYPRSRVSPAPEGRKMRPSGGGRRRPPGLTRLLRVYPHCLRTQPGLRTLGFLPFPCFHPLNGGSIMPGRKTTIIPHTPGGERLMSLKSLIATGTKVWLDSVEPDLVSKNRAWAPPAPRPTRSSFPTSSRRAASTTRSPSWPRRAWTTRRSPGSWTTSW